MVMSFTNRAARAPFAVLAYLFSTIVVGGKVYCQATPLTPSPHASANAVHPFEVVLRNARRDQAIASPTSPLGDYIVQHAAVPEMRRNLAQQISLAIQQSEVDARSKKRPYLHESAIIEAYKQWCVLAGVQANVDSNSVDALHSYRQFISHFLPSLSMRGANGGMVSSVTPAESVYLFDTLVSHGGVPDVMVVGAAGSKLKTSVMTTASANRPNINEGYYASTNTLRRTRDLASALAQLGISISVPDPSK